MQRRRDRSCGKVPVRIILWSVSYYRPGPSIASGSSCYVCLFSLSLMGGARNRSQLFAVVLPFFFFLLVCSYISVHTGLAMRFAGTASSCTSCFFCPYSSSCLLRPATAVIFVLVSPCNKCLFLFSTRGVPLAIAACIFLFDLVASYSSEHILVAFV